MPFRQWVKSMHFYKCAAMLSNSYTLVLVPAILPYTDEQQEIGAGVWIDAGLIYMPGQKSIYRT